MTIDLQIATTEIIAAGRFLATRNWAPATAGNYSMRLSDGTIAITVSGMDKGDLTPDSIMLIDADGKPLDQRKPSAETLLHVGIYQSYPKCHAVLHTHSENSTVFTKRYQDLSVLRLTDYEFLKLFPSVTTHEATVDIPIFNNTQDIQTLRAKVDKVLVKPLLAYLIRAHGLYGWGHTMGEARRIVEAVEFMVGCELHLRA